MEKNDCLTDSELAQLLADQLPAHGNRLMEHLNDCEVCQRKLAIAAGDASWITDLKLKHDAAEMADCETELVNVIERMSTKTATIRVGENDSKSLSFQGRPFTEQIVAGRRFGSYEIQSRLGTGGMSVVFAAYDHVLDRQVAIKFLSPELEHDQSARRRFLREAKAAAAVENDFIVPIHAADDVGGFPFLVMSLIDGQSVQQRIDEPTPLAINEIVRIGTQIAKGLEAFHSRGLVHRDLKPSNILLQKPDNRVRITDFGLAKCADDSQLTKSGTIIGTPHYMSPEQAWGKDVDFRSDLYSLGATLYACITARAPYEGQNSLHILNQLREGSPPRILDLNPGAPPWLVEIIEKLMHRQPSERFQNAADIIKALSRSGPTDAKKTANASATQYATLAITIATVVVLGILLTFGFSSFSQSNESAAKSDETTMVPSATDPAGFRITVKTAGGVAMEFPTLKEAVNKSSDGDIIELEGNGTHEVESTIQTAGKALSICSVPGSSPVLMIDNSDLQTGIESDASLVLEGLTFRLMNGETSDSVRNAKFRAVHCTNGDLQISNCRFDAINSKPQTLSCITAIDARLCSVRNSEFYSGPMNVGIELGMMPGTKVELENNLFVAGSALDVTFPVRTIPGLSTALQIKNNNFAAISGLLIAMPPGPQNQQQARTLVDASANLWDVEFLVSLGLRPVQENQSKPILNPRVIEQMMLWQSRHNQFRVRQAYVGLSIPRQKIRVMRPLSTFAEWNGVWRQADTSSIHLETPPRSTGMPSRVPSTLGPQDFLQLFPKHYANSNQDIGARLEQVGPGTAYANRMRSPNTAQ